MDGRLRMQWLLLKVDVVIGADGANSRVAKAIDAGEYNFAIAFQVCYILKAVLWAS
jgi:geranylgeranyl reductase